MGTKEPLCYCREIEREDGMRCPVPGHDTEDPAVAAASLGPDALRELDDLQNGVSAEDAALLAVNDALLAAIGRSVVMRRVHGKREPMEFFATKMVDVQLAQVSLAKIIAARIAARSSTPALETSRNPQQEYEVSVDDRLIGVLTGDSAVDVAREVADIHGFDITLHESATSLGRWTIATADEHRVAAWPKKAEST